MKKIIKFFMSVFLYLFKFRKLSIGTCETWIIFICLYLYILCRSNSVRLLPKGHCSAEFVIWLREKLGICNSHRWENKLCEAEKRLFLMRCFVALRQWELQTPVYWCCRIRKFGRTKGRMPKLNCSSGSSDACLAARVVRLRNVFVIASRIYVENVWRLC